VPRPDPEGLDDEHSGRPPGFELNPTTGDADTSGVTIIDESAHQAGRRESIDEAELDRLRAKVSFLSMQKDYWWQRSAEHAEALRAAEAENLRLREALTELQARRIIRALR
jgi:hypothetical protein